MKTHIFFDTNILEIPKSKDFSQFKFSGEFQKVIDFIDEYNLCDKINIIVPKIVLEELLKHYKEDFKEKYDKVKNEIIEIDKCFGSVLNQPLEFLPKYNKSEYYKFIKKSLKEYTENLIIPPYPKDISSIIERAIDIRKPFVSRKINGKDHKDGGFKDVVIWETILKYNFESEDVIVLFSKDSDFEEAILKKEIKNTFRVISNFSTLKEFIIDVHEISDPYYKILKLAKSDYFVKDLVKKIKNQLKHQLEEDNISLKEINIDKNKIKVLYATYDDAYDMIEWDYGKGYYDMHFYDKHGDELTEEYLKATIPVEFIYEERDSGTHFKSYNCIDCISDLVEIRSYGYPAYILDKNREIIDYDK